VDHHRLGENSIGAQFRERLADQRPATLRGVPLAPGGSAQPVTELRFIRPPGSLSSSTRLSTSAGVKRRSTSPLGLQEDVHLRILLAA
jgi:hypothetical protein